MPSQSTRPLPRRSAKPRLDDRLADEARFIKTWLDNPILTGAVSPSGRSLARMMARAVDPDGTGPIVELGPGTGPITEALLKRGVAPRRLLLLEFDGAFCRLLRKRFPGVQVVQADAYKLRDSLRDVLTEPAAAIVSSLPLLNKPELQRVALLDDAFALMAPGGAFVQFTYGMASPVPRAAAAVYDAEISPPIWLNLPPARVWVYRRKTEGGVGALDVSPRDAKRLGLRASETRVFRPAAFHPVAEKSCFGVDAMRCRACLASEPADRCNCPHWSRRCTSARCSERRPNRIARAWVQLACVTVLSSHSTSPGRTTPPGSSRRSATAWRSTRSVSSSCTAAA